MTLAQEFNMTDDTLMRCMEYVIQARDGLITKAEMADKIEALFDRPFERVPDVVGPVVDESVLDARSLDK